MPGSLSRFLRLLSVLGLLVALGAAVMLVALRAGEVDAPDEVVFAPGLEPGVLLLEPADVVGPDPFTPPVAVDLGIDPAKCEKASVVIIVDTISLYPEEFYKKGIQLVTSSVPRIPGQCLDPRIKSLNYLNNIMAKIEARRAGVPEALMLNYNGRVAECTADNIFIVKNGKLATPDLMEGALGGGTRKAVIALVREVDITVKTMMLGLHDLYNADECFLTGTGAEIVPVVTIDGRQIGTGRPGELPRDLLALYRKLRVRDGARVEYTQAAPAGQ